MTALVNVERTRDHWYWRPGWRIGRRFHTWHLTFGDDPAMHRLVAAYQQSLARTPGLDLIPPRWLHLTTQGLGFTDDLSTSDVDAVVAAVRRRLADVPAPLVTFHRPIVIAEAIVLPPHPTEPVRQVREAIRAGIADAWGAQRVPEPTNRFRPHVSLAYSNTAAPAAPIIAALDATQPEPATIRLAEASLILLGRDEHLYRWNEYATATIGHVQPPTDA